MPSPAGPTAPTSPRPSPPPRAERESRRALYPSPPFRGEREGPTPQAWEGEVGDIPRREIMPAAKAAASAPSSSSPPIPRISCRTPRASPPPGSIRSIAAMPNGNTPCTVAAGRSIRLTRSRSSGRRALSRIMYRLCSHSGFLSTLTVDDRAGRRLTRFHDALASRWRRLPFARAHRPTARSTHHIGSQRRTRSLDDHPRDSCGSA